MDTEAVTKFIINTHCTVCNTAFEKGRVGKLYCSSRCKQFGYNYKDQIESILPSGKLEINALPLVFFIDD